MKMDLVIVRAFAVHAHRAQRYGDAPYDAHLDAVVAVLIESGVTDEDVIAAGLLHDAPEDTDVTVRDVQRVASPRAAAIVDAVTDGPGRNRAERKERPYRLIPFVPGAILVKLADRTANAEHARATGSHLLGMYQKEQPGFRARLYRPGEADAMWARLERALAA